MNEMNRRSPNTVVKIIKTIMHLTADGRVDEKSAKPQYGSLINLSYNYHFFLDVFFSYSIIRSDLTGHHVKVGAFIHEACL